MSDLTGFSRRDLLVQIGISASMAAAGESILSAQQAEHVHQTVAGDKAANQGHYQPKSLTVHEYATLQRLSDLIIPADEHSPGALQAGAADFVDFMCAASDDMKVIYTGGLAWLDDAMRRRNDGKDFLGSSAEQQTAMLDLIAFRENRTPEIAAGIRFFDWTRRMVVDAYYTSPIGIKDVGFMGNGAMSKFSVPQDAVDYALKRSGL